MDQNLCSVMYAMGVLLTNQPENKDIWLHMHIQVSQNAELLHFVFQIVYYYFTKYFRISNWMFTNMLYQNKITYKHIDQLITYPTHNFWICTWIFYTKPDSFKLNQLGVKIGSSRNTNLASSRFQCQGVTTCQYVKYLNSLCSFPSIQVKK